MSDELPAKLENVTHWVEMLQSDDPYMQRQGWVQVFPLVDDLLKRWLGDRFGKALRQASISDVKMDVIHAAMVGLPSKKARGSDEKAVMDSGWFRGFVLQVAFNKATDRLRDRAKFRKRFEELARQAGSPAAPGTCGWFGIADLENLRQAIVALRDHELKDAAPGEPVETPLTNALIARFLVDTDARLYLDGGELPDRIEAAQVRDTRVKYEEVGALLGFPEERAYQRAYRLVQEALAWLNRNRPDLVPHPPAKQASGRRKGGAAQANPEEGGGA